MIHNIGPIDQRRYRQESQTATLRKPFHRAAGSSSTAVTPIDCDAEYWSIVNNIKQQRENRLRQPIVKFFDGNWILRGRASQIYTASWQEIEGETGTGKIEMPIDYYLSQWVIAHGSRSTKNIHVTVDKDGVRWSGRMDHYEIEKQQDGTTICRVLFKHDFEELKHILCWSNPFLPAEIQFPKWWILFGPAKWCLKTTLFCNILRLESSLWMLPDDPLNANSWFDLDQSTWSMVVAPDPVGQDNSVFSILLARFKDFFTVAKPVLQDAQLTPTFRRYLTGDPPPWQGANLRNGCLIIDILDKSGFTTGTSFGGDLFTGLLYAVQQFTTDGYDDGTQPIPDPNFPEEYYQPGWIGTLPSCPGIIYREESHSGIQTSLFTGSPAKDVQHVTGGHSMPGVVCALV